MKSPVPYKQGGRQWIVAWMEGGQRRRISYKTKEEADAFAATLALVPVGPSLSPTEMSALRDMAVLAAKHRRTVRDLVIEVDNALMILGGSNLAEAAATHARAFPLLKRIEVFEAAKQFIIAKRADGKSELYVDDLILRIERFCDEFRCDVVDVTEQDINRWLRALKTKAGAALSPQSRNNYRRVVRTFIEFCTAESYCRPIKWESVAISTVPPSTICIFSPIEMERLLRHASRTRPETIPYLVLGGLCGLRTAEIERLTWSHVDLAAGHVKVSPEITKTRRRRIAPLCPAAIAWLAPMKREGKVNTIRWIPYTMLKVAAAAGVPWKTNALRHSFISYRCAIVRNVAQVADEAGNSSDQIHRSYRELVTASEASVFFNILPTVPAISLPS